MACVKIAKCFAWLFALCGIVLMLGTAVICFASMDSSVKILENPDGAIACSEQLQKSLQSGDLTQVGQLLYGQPNLGAEGTPENACTARLWEAWRGSITLKYSRLYLRDGELGRDGEITVLDVSKVTADMQRRAKTLLQTQLDALEEGDQLSVQERDQILLKALEETLQKDAAYQTREISVKLVFRDGKWWVVPDAAFLKALSGFAE